MNTLLPNSLKEILSKWDGFNESIHDFFNQENVFPAELEGLQGCLSSFYTAAYINSSSNNLKRYIQYHALQKKHGSEKLNESSSDFIIIVPTEKEADEVLTDLQTIFDNGKDAVIYQFPWWAVVPYRPAPKGSSIFGKRAGVLSKLAFKRYPATIKIKPRIIIITQRVFETPVPPPEYMESLIFSLQKNQLLDTVALAAKLTRNGYTRVPKVGVRGEFALRGEVLDIFMPEEEYAHRIVFDFDRIEYIKTFDPLTQSTCESVDSILIYPMKEVIWTDEFIKKIEEKLLVLDKNAVGSKSRDIKDLSSLDDAHLAMTTEARKFMEQFLTELSVNGESEGEELFYSLIWDKKYSILDYLTKDAVVFYYDYDRLANAQESLSREYSGMYRKARQEMPVLPPSDMLFDFIDLVFQHTKSIFYKTIHTDVDKGDVHRLGSHYRIECEPPQSFFGNINYLKEQISNLQSNGWKIFVYTDNPNQTLRIDELLKDFTHPVNPDVYPVCLVPAAISAGFSIDALKILVIQENEIFGRRKHVPKSLHSTKSEVIDTFVELNPGDYIVHVNYGIGIFRGIERVKAMGNERDYIKLEYADDEIAFVPIEQVNLIQRYIGNEGENPRIDRIGSKSWENRKNRVKKSVEDIAEKLIQLYSKRKAAKGFPFPKDTEWQTSFEAAFPYEDTPDQISVTTEVKADMEKPVPMDRLICGDVGYGKTEIAMRAAFKAVMGGKQVAFLAPTTILAEQHYDTCIERFENFPVKIAQLSRFIVPSEQKKILEKLTAGEIDILIGTHRIIQKDVKFKNLGLMIIDEEQRFGVKDKEKLKILKNNIDSLAMSATPIPRTLHMSLLKIRDMSLLTTPPQNRQAIETVIDSYNDSRVAKAIRREVERGGQVFYLHNRVETLDETRRKIEAIVPEMLVDIAHGQMSSEQLDDIFRRFKMGGFHVLVATTIIENGIDIPNVNTIIIDRADMYGVSQLYQLRGRVGRSDRKAYAYLFYPDGKSLSEVAMKRLQVISDFTELGSGFKIAMKDMEIRGAGNLLGKDQSGDVYSVGFELYLKLLNDAVRHLTEKNYSEQTEVFMELEYTGFISDSYIENPQTKMEIYKKIASVQTREELDGVYSELLDRFGPLPDEVNNLMSLAEIRIICRLLFISTIKEKKGCISIEFAKVSNISVDKVLKLIRAGSGTVKLDSQNPNILLLETGKIGLREKADFIKERLEYLL
jgi:transcription-repair coupling factor (superfamily II helicase)